MKSGQATKVLFMGTPDFSVPSLKTLAGLPGFDIVGVITQPDRAVGRLHTMTPPAVKQAATKLGLSILQPEKLTDDVVKKVRDLAPDLIVVVAYGKIIPQTILDVPRLGSINVHASLLPSYRGASPIQAAIVAGDKTTGITIMLMDEKMDHGPILMQKETLIAADETGGSLFEKLAPLGAKLLGDALPRWVHKDITPKEQDHEKATFCKPLTRDDGKINWSEPARAIERKVRAYSPWPGTWTMWNKVRLHIRKGEVVTGKPEHPYGFVFKTKNGCAVQCGEQALSIKEMQLEGKNPMMTDAFLCGHPEIIGQTLES